MKENEKDGLIPVTEEELEMSYGLGCSCPPGTHGPDDYYPECCLHDCKGADGKGSKLWTGWN